MFTFVKPTPDLGATVFWPLTATEAFDVPELAVFSEETLDLLYPIDTYMEGYTKTVLQKARALIDDPANFGPFSDDEAGQYARSKYLMIAYRQELADIGAELEGLISSEFAARPEYVKVTVDCSTLPVVEELLAEGIVVAAVNLDRDDERLTVFMVLGAIKE